MASQKYSLLPEIPQGYAEHFWSQIFVQESTGCWFFRGPKTGKAQHRTRIPGIPGQHNVYRLAYKIHYGIDPFGYGVCHHCDNNPCVNPEHLFLGTQQDNIQDAVNKGRISHGESHYYHLHPEEMPRMYGDDNPSRKHPEKLRRGENHPRVLNPEKWDPAKCAFVAHPEQFRGENHWTRQDPLKKEIAIEKGRATLAEHGYDYIKRGDEHPRKLHPEKWNPNYWKENPEANQQRLEKVIGENHYTKKQTEEERRIWLSARSGANCKTAKLSTEQAQQILDSPSDKESYAMAAEFGVSWRTARAIRRGWSWKHLAKSQDSG